MKVWCHSTEACNAELRISREDQDAFSARSHQRAAEAWKNGLFDDEVVPVEIPQRKGDPVQFKDDEGIRPDTTTESLLPYDNGLAGVKHLDAGTSVCVSLKG
jgi:acetyl-CoA C-acetyltransferase